MAEAFLGALARKRHLDISAESAGILGGDRPMPSDALEVIGQRGLDMSTHRSRQLDASNVRRSDLVLGMAREHVREAVLLDPSAWARCFTLKELVRRGEQVGPREREQLLSGWLEVVGAGRRREALMGSSPIDDVEDPVNGGPAMYRATGEEVHDLVIRLLALIEPQP